MISDIQKTAEDRIQHSLEVLKENLAKVHTGRTYTGLLDQVEVEYWGSMVLVSQVASTTLVDTHTIGVKPLGSNMAAKVEKTIHDSNLGLSPTSVDDSIHVPVLILTEERRKDLIKAVHNEVEGGCVLVHNAYCNASDHIRKPLRDKEVSEDETRRGGGAVQKLANKYISEADRILVTKEEDLMAI